MIENIAKRMYDIIFAVLFFVLLSPIYLLTVVIIKFTSKGPVLYKTKRIGLYGKEFICYKFRSMRVDSGKVRITTLRNDVRVYPFGKFIRKIKIDEFPQVFNIILGQMSVVGPRPEDKENADKIYIEKYKPILYVKPGLTSPASIFDYTHGEKFETEETYINEFLPQKLELELYYVNHHSFWYDVKLTAYTALIILQIASGKNDFKLPKEYMIIEKQNKYADKGNIVYSDL